MQHAHCSCVHGACWIGKGWTGQRRGTGDNGVALGVGLVVSRVSRVAWRGSEMEEDWTRRSDELSDWLERHRPAQQPSPQPASLWANGRAEAACRQEARARLPWDERARAPPGGKEGPGAGVKLRDQGCIWQQGSRAAIATALCSRTASCASCGATALQVRCEAHWELLSAGARATAADATADEGQST
ncbi:hypothetical protein KVR01_005607 [Diaporthe batatas]|uniref:uncharacterized protein n=1 Tax=Diaporthe batatas TaxID=748121 RepID=UPI001D04507E|nr:uncharacterized protein KVR01_005607 [Diaporthe batatas]KAG8165332.1 hypothetical protein KVR01_005607 [Diaporthe batatas]